MTDRQRPDDEIDGIEDDGSVFHDLFEQAVEDVRPTPELRAALNGLGDQLTGDRAPSRTKHGNSRRIAVAAAAVLLTAVAAGLLSGLGGNADSNLRATDTTTASPSRSGQWLLPIGDRWLPVSFRERLVEAGTNPLPDVWAFAQDERLSYILLDRESVGDDPVPLDDASVRSGRTRAMATWSVGGRELTLIGFGLTEVSVLEAARSLERSGQGWSIPGHSVVGRGIDETPAGGSGSTVEYAKVGQDGSIDTDTVIIHRQSPGSAGDLYRTLANSSDRADLATLTVGDRLIYVVEDASGPFAVGQVDGRLSTWRARSGRSDSEILDFVAALETVDEARWHAAVDGFEQNAARALDQRALDGAEDEGAAAAEEPGGDPPSRTWPGQTSVPTGNPAGFNRAGGFAVGVIEGTGEVVAVDLATGAVDRRLTTINLEARWIGRIQLNWDGTAIYYHAQTEDSWFSCQSSPGSVIRLELDGGEEALVAAGAEPQISPDGSRLAYLAASQCLPDPQDEANFVVTPYDTVVVRDLATGREQTWIDRELQAALATTEGDVGESQLGGLAWLGPDRLAVGAVRLSASSMEVIGQGTDLRFEVGGSQRLIGQDATTGLFLVEQDAFGSNGDSGVRLLRLDPGNGDGSVSEVSQSRAPVVAFDSPYANLAVIEDGRLFTAGAAITVEVKIDNFDW